MKNIAVILGGGSGKRSGSTLPKQFLKVVGVTIVESSMDVFSNSIHNYEAALVA